MPRQLYVYVRQGVHRSVQWGEKKRRDWGCDSVHAVRRKCIIFFWGTCPIILVAIVENPACWRLFLRHRIDMNLILWSPSVFPNTPTPVFNNLGKCKLDIWTWKSGHGFPSVFSMFSVHMWRPLRHTFGIPSGSSWSSLTSTCNESWIGDYVPIV